MKQSRLGVLVGAGAITVGALMTVLAPAAHAKPIGEGTIKAECKAAGGTYETTVVGNKGGSVRASSCTYKDIDGGYNTDSYTNGNYSGTVHADGSIT